MTTFTPIICQDRGCAHYRLPIGPDMAPLYACLAFPDGIPDTVLSGQNLHMQPIQGDGGLIFAPNGKPGTKAAPDANWADAVEAALAAREFMPRQIAIDGHQADTGRAILDVVLRLPANPPPLSVSIYPPNVQGRTVYHPLGEPGIGGPNGILEIAIPSGNAKQVAWAVAHALGHAYSLRAYGTGMASTDEALLSLLGFKSEFLSPAEGWALVERGAGVVNVMRAAAGGAPYYSFVGDGPWTHYGRRGPEDAFADSFAAYLVDPGRLPADLRAWLGQHVFAVGGQNGNRTEVL